MYPINLMNCEIIAETHFLLINELFHRKNTVKCQRVHNL